MPSTYAHRRFGTNVLEHLPDELRAQLEQNRELYDIGLHGPDLLFYYHAAKSNPVGALGNAMHEEPGRVFFDRARRVVHCEADRDAALAYALGFCVPLCAGQHLPPVCGAVHPGKRRDPLRDRDRV